MLDRSRFGNGTRKVFLPTSASIEFWGHQHDKTEFLSKIYIMYYNFCSTFISETHSRGLLSALDESRPFTLGRMCTKCILKNKIIFGRRFNLNQ